MVIELFTDWNLVGKISKIKKLEGDGVRLEYKDIWLPFKAIGHHKEESSKIEKLSYNYLNTYGNVSQHRKSEEPLIDKINEIIDYINKKEGNK